VSKHVTGWSTLLALAFAMGPANEAAAQPQPPPRRPGSGLAPGRPPSTPVPPHTATRVDAAASDFRARFGVDMASKLLRSPDADERLRGLERAAATRTPEALSLLERASAPGLVGGATVDGAARQDSRALLVVVRGLASWTDREPARAALENLLSPTSASGMHVAAGAGRDPAADEADNTARVLLALREAAMALAQSDNVLTLEALVATARSGGPGQGAALEALALHPPATPLLAGVAMTTPGMVALAAKLGDLRSTGAILGAVHASDPALRSAAIAALGVIGDARVLDLAREAAKDKDPRVRVAGGDALAHLGSADAAAAVEALVGDDATARDGLRIAPYVRSEGIAKAAAARAAASADPELRALAILALGRQVSPSAVTALVTLAGDVRLAGDVMDALARSPSAAAMTAMETMAAAPTTRRLVGRGYFVRRMVRGERSDWGDRLLAALAASGDGTDRAVGVEALVALGERRLEDALEDRDPRVRRAAAMGSVALSSPTKGAVLTAHLVAEQDETTRRVLAVGLADGDPAGVVPTTTLLDRAQAGGPDAPLAALALARRADDALAPKVDALLASRDPLMRAHVARGLMANKAPEAAGRLARAYAWEPVVEVRRALIEALAGRASALPLAPCVEEALSLAARLDPDPVTRALAARSLRGEAPADVMPGREVAWLRVLPADAAALPRELTGTAVQANGVAWPVVFDEDGYALLPGLTPGDVRLGLAPRLPAYQPR
jgi:hypothetical protein